MKPDVHVGAHVSRPDESLVFRGAIKLLLRCVCKLRRVLKHIHHMAPAKGSRKGKKTWRKNINTRQVIRHAKASRSFRRLPVLGPSIRL